MPRLAAAGHPVAILAHSRTARDDRVAQAGPDMDGWMAYHAAFVACVAAALYRCGTDPGALAADRPALRLMSAAVTEAFAGLRKLGAGGRPRNLVVLQQLLREPSM